MHRTSAAIRASHRFLHAWTTVLSVLVGVAIGLTAASAQTYTFTTFAGTVGQIGSADGTGNAARFSNPSGMDLDSAGNLYVADRGNHTIRKITPAGVVSTLAGSAGQSGSADGPGATARFNGPTDVAVDSAGNVYVVDRRAVVRKITPAGVVSTMVETGAPAPLVAPFGVAVDSTGNVFVTDRALEIVGKMTPAGIATVFAGSPTQSGSTDGMGGAAQFHTLSGIVADSTGGLYVIDNDNYTVRKITAAGAVSTLAGTARQAGSIDATGSAARFYFRDSAGVSVDSTGNVFVADDGNQTIRKITAAGVVSTVAGLAGSSGSADGVGSSARFQDPLGLVVDSAGNIYVTDTGNQTIRRGAVSGVVAPPTAPVIVTQPVGATVNTGSTWTLIVVASGSPAPTYQWYKDGGTVAGATSATLSLTNITAAAAGSYTVLVSNSAGSAVSTAAVIALTSVPPPITAPPVIVVPPTNRVALTGGSVTFAVAVTVGGTSVNYQNNPNRIALAFTWRRNGQDVDLNASSGKYGNSSGDVLTINSLTAADAGDYTVTITTAGGTVTSSPATLSLSTPIAPVITSQPRGATVNAGSTLALTVTATGSPTPTYQWRKDGVTLDGATSDSLVLASAGTSAAGNYTVVVANSAGSVTSSTAAVAVTSGQPSRLPNLSVRANLGASQTLIVGFATIGAKTRLVRGIGPTLAAFGLAGVLPDPTIELYNSASTKIDENNDWSPSLASVFVDVGAFALTGGSKDAALQRTCNGANTAQIRSVGTGVVLVEVYDSGGTGKLINVSARNAVGTGDNILIAGFVVDGTAAKTLLIRGVGAKLAEFGVGGVLADPKLEIYSSAGVKIAENDSWNPLLQPVARSVGAFDLTLGSRDAALLLTLAPGTYTAQISGVGGGTGEALVEVYEVP